VSRNISRIAWTAALACAVALVWSPLAQSKHSEPFRPPAKQTLEIRGFSKSGKEVAFFVKDADRGSYFEVRNAKKGKRVKLYPVRSSEKSTWRRVKREHDIVSPLHDAAENPRKDLSLVVTAKGAELVIEFARDGRLIEYERISLLEPRKGKPAKAYAKQMAWGPKGKHVAIVYHQKVRDLLTWEGDFIHTFKLKSYRLDME